MQLPIWTFLLISVVACAAPRATWKEGGPCPSADLLGSESTCVCTAAASGPVWGTGQYTSDSSICRAARHAGVITDAGRVTVRRSPGCPRYRGLRRNDISSSSYGTYHRSFYFPSVANGTCDQLLPGVEPEVEASPPTRGGPPTAAPAHWGQAGPGQIRACPRVLPGIDDGSPMTGTCLCAAPIAAGPVWGAGPYALDSDLCAAALHAGAIGLGGGPIEVEIIPGCGRYASGAGEHGVSARASEPTSWAFRFAARPVACAP